MDSDYLYSQDGTDLTVLHLITALLPLNWQAHFLASFWNAIGISLWSVSFVNVKNRQIHEKNGTSLNTG